MKIDSIIELARKNDPLAKEWLAEHYGYQFANKVRKTWGDKLGDRALDIVPSLLEEYFENNYKYPIYSFLKNKAITFGKTKREIIGDEIDILDEEKLNYVIEHYSEGFLEKIRPFNTVLTDYQLKKFARCYVKSLCFNSQDKKSNIKLAMNTSLNKEVRAYQKNEERLLMRYVLVNGLDDNIVTYFCDKYRYMLQDERIVFARDYLLKNYDNLIIECLYEFKSVASNIGNMLKRKINKIACEEYSFMEKCLVEARNGSKEAADLIHKKYEYIKDKLFNDYKDRINVNEAFLKDIIDEKYDEYLNAYLSGNSNCPVSRYMNTRLKLYVNQVMYAYMEVKENYDEINEVYKFYLYYVSKYLKDVKGYLPPNVAREKLTKVYKGSIIRSVISGSENNTGVNTAENLRYEVRKINDEYSYNNIIALSELYKEKLRSSKMFSDPEANEIIDNLTKYYLENYKIMEDEYEKYIIKVIYHLNKESLTNFEYKDKDFSKVKKYPVLK